jgi:hypothetical protein
MFRGGREICLEAEKIWTFNENPEFAAKAHRRPEAAMFALEL